MLIPKKQLNRMVFNTELRFYRLVLENLEHLLTNYFDEGISKGYHEDLNRLINFPIGETRSEPETEFIQSVKNDVKNLLKVKKANKLLNAIRELIVKIYNKMVGK